MWGRRRGRWRPRTPASSWTRSPVPDATPTATAPGVAAPAPHHDDARDDGDAEAAVATPDARTVTSVGHATPPTFTGDTQAVLASLLEEARHPSPSVPPSVASPAFAPSSPRRSASPARPRKRHRHAPARIHPDYADDAAPPDHLLPSPEEEEEEEAFDGAARDCDVRVRRQTSVAASIRQRRGRAASSSAAPQHRSPVRSGGVSGGGAPGTSPTRKRRLPLTVVETGEGSPVERSRERSPVKRQRLAAARPSRSDGPDYEGRLDASPGWDAYAATLLARRIPHAMVERASPQGTVSVRPLLAGQIPPSYWREQVHLEPTSPPSCSLPKGQSSVALSDLMDTLNREEARGGPWTLDTTRVGPGRQSFLVMFVFDPDHPDWHLSHSARTLHDLPEEYGEE